MNLLVLQPICEKGGRNLLFFVCFVMKETKDKIEALLQQYLEDEKYFVVDIKVSLSKVHSKVVILLDSDAGISIDECSEISRKIGKDLDEIMPDKYTLEVSSPGVDIPLTFNRQYHKNVGRNLKVVLKSGQEYKGLLETVEAEKIIIREDKKVKKGEVIEPLAIAFEEIKQAQVLISFK